MSPRSWRSIAKQAVTIVLEVVDLGDFDLQPTPANPAMDGDRQKRADQGTEPVDPPSMPLVRDHRRRETAGGIGAGPGDAGFKPDHDRVERRKQKWCMRPQGSMPEEEEPSEDQR